MKILITGATGFLGARINMLLKQRHETVALSSALCDLTDFTTVRNLMDTLRPVLVIHCAAVGDILTCENDHDRAMRVNVAGTRHIASCCAAYGAAMIFASSDQVYNYYTMQRLDEYSVPDPTNFYGWTKLQAERIVSALLPRHHILRLSWQYGKREPGLPCSRDGLLEQMQSCLKREQIIYYTPDAYQNISYVYDTARAVVQMAEGNIPYGVYNLASENTWTEYETKAYMLQRLGAPDEMIRRLLKAKPDARPFDLRAIPRNLELAGYRFPTFAEGLKHCLEDE